MEKVSKEKWKKKFEKKRSSRRVINKNVWHGCISVLIFNGQLNWGVFLCCVLRECALIIIGVSVGCSLARNLASHFPNHLSLSYP